MGCRQEWPFQYETYHSRNKHNLICISESRSHSETGWPDGRKTAGGTRESASGMTVLQSPLRIEGQLECS